MKAFFDSSGLAKRYTKERGSDKVERALEEASEAVKPPSLFSITRE